MSQVSIINYENYREFIQARLEQDGQKRGGKRQLAAFLRVHSSFVSQVLSGTKDFSQDQVFKLKDFFGLNDLEVDYFLLLVHEAKAVDPRLQKYFQKKRAHLARDSKRVSSNIPNFHELSVEQQAMFYSDPLYSQIRILTSIPEFCSLESLARALHLDTNQCQKYLNYLLSNDLCQIDPSGKISIGPARTHIDADSPFVNLHHKNWRLRAIELHRTMTFEDLAYTAPLSMSHEDFSKFKEQILQLIKDLHKVVMKSNSEVPVVFSVDWLRML